MIPPQDRPKFLRSVHQLQQLPPDEGAEVAFAGRSNVGKSSALNALTGMRGLARTSKTPGRTQALNFFALPAHRRLVDLPGYGFARVPRHVQEHWRRIVSAYLQRRRSLRGLILLMDARRPLTPLDEQLLDWCRHRGLLVHVLLTKSDKLSRGAAAAVLHRVRAALEEPGNEHATVQLFSAQRGIGVDEARARMRAWLEEAPAPRDTAAATLRGGKKRPRSQ